MTYLRGLHMSNIKLFLKNTLLFNLVFISFAASAQEIEEVVDPDGDLSDEPVFRFFHRDGNRQRILRRAELRKRLEQKEHNKKEER